MEFWLLGDRIRKIQLTFFSINAPTTAFFFRVTNAFGKVNSSGSTGGGGQNFELIGISKIRVALLGGIDILSFQKGMGQYKDWGGNLDPNFGNRPSMPLAV